MTSPTPNVKNFDLNAYHPSIYPDVPEFGDFCVASDGSSDNAKACFEE